MNNNSPFANFFYYSNLKYFLDLPAQKEDSILVFDYCGVQDIYTVCDELAEELLPLKLNFVSALMTRWKPGREVKVNTMNLIKPPMEVWYQADEKLDPLVNGEECESLKQLQDLVHIFKLSLLHKRPSVDTNLIRNQMLTCFYFSVMTLRVTMPKLVIIWNQFHALSQVAVEACKFCNIPYSFFEYGVLPGTLNFDFKGQMGESVVATDSQRFQSLPITSSDLSAAKSTLSYLKMSGINRKNLPEVSNLRDLVASKAEGRKVILYAGQNDPASGVIPYTEKVRTEHSPIFEQTQDAAEFLISEAEKHNWFILYKPHPHYNRQLNIADGSNHMMVTQYNINECIDVSDVVTTIFSQTSFVSLIRETPVVMMGYNHLRNSGAIYQAERVDDIVQHINIALDQGFTEVQRNAFEEHVARLLRYYLYRYGSDAPEEVAAQDISDLAKMFKYAVENKSFQDFGYISSLKA
ncbi:MAG: hypothetical protein AAF621_05545 [Pseudomonadota bacterium]